MFTYVQIDESTFQLSLIYDINIYMYHCIRCDIANRIMNDVKYPYVFIRVCQHKSENYLIFTANERFACID